MCQRLLGALHCFKDDQRDKISVLTKLGVSLRRTEISRKQVEAILLERVKATKL